METVKIKLTIDVPKNNCEGCQFRRYHSEGLVIKAITIGIHVPCLNVGLTIIKDVSLVNPWR